MASINQMFPHTRAWLFVHRHYSNLFAAVVSLPLSRDAFSTDDFSKKPSPR
jgi:hypothetical protein